jgi:hypothetical protein
MRIGIIGPSKLRDKDKTVDVAKIIAESGNEVVLTPDESSSSEFFALEYIKNKGGKLYSILSLNDKEFGYDWVNTELGEPINCGTWRNQPEKLNEETDILISIGPAVGGMIEIGYTKWFKPKPVYIITDIDSERLPKVMEEELDIHYISINDLKKVLK